MSGSEGSSGAVGLGGGVAQYFVGAAVPQHHAALAVVALGDDALEGAVFDGVIFHHHGEVLHGGVQGWALRHGPRLQDPSDFQAQVVVQVTGVVPLDAILPRPAGMTRGWLWCAIELAFGAVAVQAHTTKNGGNVRAIVGQPWLPPYGKGI